MRYILNASRVIACAAACLVMTASLTASAQTQGLLAEKHDTLVSGGIRDLKSAHSAMQNIGPDLLLSHLRESFSTIKELRKKIQTGNAASLNAEIADTALRLRDQYRGIYALRSAIVGRYHQDDGPLVQLESNLGVSIAQTEIEVRTLEAEINNLNKQASSLKGDAASRNSFKISELKNNLAYARFANKQLKKFSDWSKNLNTNRTTLLSKIDLFFEAIRIGSQAFDNMHKAASLSLALQDAIKEQDIFVNQIDELTSQVIATIEDSTALIDAMEVEFKVAKSS